MRRGSSGSRCTCCAIREDARDAAQESLVKLVQRGRPVPGQSQFSTWLHRLVVNTCKDVAQARWARSGGPSRSTRTRASRRRRPGPRARRVGGAARARPLPGRAAAPPRRRVVALKDAFDVPFDEISAATGLPVGTAKCYAHRGRNGCGNGCRRDGLLSGMTTSCSWTRPRSRRCCRTATRCC